MTVNWLQIALAVLQAAAGGWFAYQGNLKLAGIAACYTVANVLIGLLEG